MIDTWFKKDLEKIYSNHQIVVFVDESTEADFLLKGIDEKYTIFKTTNEIEELKAKYEIEKHKTSSNKYLIYTTTPKDKLKFIREYCETNGSVEIKYLQNYIKDKVYQNLRININLEKDELITSAKVSVGKSQTYWMDLSHKGASEIFDMEKELLPFFNQPEKYINSLDESVQKQFLKKVNEVINQPSIEKPAKTLATELVYNLFDSLASPNKPNEILFEVYKKWVDSSSFRKSFDRYLSKYNLPSNVDPSKVNMTHPFIKIDELWLKDIGVNIFNKEFRINSLARINQRISNKTVRNLGIDFWKYVKVILEFDEKSINRIHSLNEAIEFYVNHFYKLDNAIRNLYSLFLDNRELIEPIQNYYKNQVSIFLDKWFNNIESYESNQTGVIQQILDSHHQKTAIVVGDGVSYEFAQDIIARVSDEYSLAKEDKQYLLAGLPSETEHNMSQLYIDLGTVVPTKAEREKYLVTNNTDKNIEFIDLEKVNELVSDPHYLICSYKDPDKLGETYQHKALKYFDTIADTFASRIEQLLKNGYKNVFLVTDHGFTLTGLLDNSDKIEVNTSGSVSKSERFIRTKTKQQYDSSLLIEKEIKYNDYNYCYFAKRLGPFKTPGVYGFSHGGFSPQEVIIPFLKWVNEDVEEGLSISIIDKRELKDVVGDLYAIKLGATADSNNLFSNERGLIIQFFANKKLINKSDLITISKGEQIVKEFQFGAFNSLEIRIVDASTQEQLDKATVTQSTARDLGGLM